MATSELTREWIKEVTEGQAGLQDDYAKEYVAEGELGEAQSCQWEAERWRGLGHLALRALDAEAEVARLRKVMQEAFDAICLGYYAESAELLLAILCPQ